MPYAASSRDTAPFGVALQPGKGSLARTRNRFMNWATEHGALADIQRFARHRLAEAGVSDGGRFPGYFVDLQPKVVDAYLQATVAGFEYPRSDLAPSVRFVGPILAPPTLGVRRAVVVGRARRRAVRWSTSPRAPSTTPTSGRLLLLTTRALADDDLLVVATTGGPDPEPLTGRSAGQRAPRAVHPPRPPAPPRRRHGDQRGLRRGAAGTGQRRPAGRRRRQRGQAGGRGARALVRHRREPAHGAPVAGHGGPCRAPVLEHRRTYRTRARGTAENRSRRAIHSMTSARRSPACARRGMRCSRRRRLTGFVRAVASGERRRVRRRAADTRPATSPPRRGPSGVSRMVVRVLTAPDVPTIRSIAAVATLLGRSAMR